jgi:uncharacterized membrane protein
LALFNFFGKKPLLSAAQEQQIVEAIRAAEKNTSGEIRVYIESHCRMVDPVDRAIEVFFGLKMEKTDQHNAVLIYVALKDRQLAVYGDKCYSILIKKIIQQVFALRLPPLGKHYNKNFLTKKMIKTNCPIILFLAVNTNST